MRKFLGVGMSVLLIAGVLAGCVGNSSKEVTSEEHHVKAAAKTEQEVFGHMKD